MNSKKSILIAGCEGLIGKTTSKLFSQKGWNVIGFDIDLDTEGNEYVDRYIPCNIKDYALVEKTISDIEKEYAIDAVFNTAGYEINTLFEETPTIFWQQLLDTILGGSANLCRAAAPYMVKRKHGKIILLCADYNYADGDNVMNAAAFGTLHGFAKSFGTEMAPENVLVNVLSANVPFEADIIAETVFYLADKDTYTSAQVVSVSGKSL